MKFKVLAMILALTVVSYAQTATQAAPPATKDQSTQTETKPDGSSCQKMMEGKEGSCCKHDMAKDSKEAMACCGGKDAKSCKKMKGDKDKMAAACGDGKCCGKEMKDCCKPGSDDEKKMAMACCGGSQCGMGHHDHGEEMK